MKNKEHIVVKDHFLTQKEFVLIKDPYTNMLRTMPKPLEGELSKYYESPDYASHNSFKKTFFTQLYFIARAFSMWPKTLMISKYFETPKKALDVGSGSGSFVRALTKKGWNAVGYEPNRKARAQAEKEGVVHITSLNNVGSSEYDLIAFWHSLEHVFFLEDTLKKTIKGLNKNGMIIIACPNYRSWDARHYNSFWAAYDTPRHLRHFAPDSLKKILTPMGMRQVNQWPLLLDAIYVSMLSEKNLKNRFWFIKGLAFGLYSNIVGFLNKNYSSHIYLFKKTL